MRINTRNELFDLADRFNVKRYEDGRIDKIDVFRRDVLIHTSQAVYTTVNGLTRLTDVKGFLFDEIWNSIETPELNWYDRNPKQISKFANSVVNSPIAIQTGWTYTVPANRKAFAEVMMISALQYVKSTGPALSPPNSSIVALYYLPAGLDAGLFTVPLMWAELLEPSAEKTESKDITGQAITLMEGDTISAQYRSNATDGMIFFQMGAKLTEFDA